MEGFLIILFIIIIAAIWLINSLFPQETEVVKSERMREHEVIKK